MRKYDGSFLRVQAVRFGLGGIFDFFRPVMEETATLNPKIGRWILNSRLIMLISSVSVKVRLNIWNLAC